MVESKRLRKKKSDFYSKSYTLLHRILTRLGQGLYPTQIATQLNVRKQNVFHYIYRLENHKYIQRDFRDVFLRYSLTEKGRKFLVFLAQDRKSPKSSLYVKESNIRSHNLGIKLRILRDNPDADFSNELNYGTNPANRGKMFTITFPIPMTVEKYTKHMVIDFHKFYTKPTTFMNDFYLRMWKGVWYISEYMKRKYDIRVDALEPEIIRFHLANERPDMNDKVKERAMVKVNLKRKSRVIFPTDMDAKAWLDRSQGNVEIETNDTLYEEKMLLMPENVDRIGQYLVDQNKIMNTFSKNIAKHNIAIIKIGEGMQDFSDNIKSFTAKTNRAVKELTDAVAVLAKAVRKPRTRAVLKHKRKAPRPQKRYIKRKLKKPKVGAFPTADEMLRGL